VGKWKRVKAGDFLEQRKKQLLIEADIEYLLVTISNKGEVKLREKKKGGLINAQKGYCVKAGDFIYSRLAVHTGAFGIIPSALDGALVTNEMPSFEINDSKIHPDILISLLNRPALKWQLTQLTKGMGRVRIKESMLLALTVLLPPRKEQDGLVRKISSANTKLSKLKSQLTHQQTLLKKLRQQILQEAIQGELTTDFRAQNPDIEPAGELLARIKAEKNQLIKDKKIKKQKPLPPISEEKKSFELPEGWKWCRVRDFASHYVDCPHDTPKYQGRGFPCLRAPDVTESGLLINSVRRVSKEEYEKRIKRLRPIRNDLVYIREGGRLGVAGLIDTDEHVCLGQRVMMLRFSNESSAKYALRFFNAPITYEDIVGKIIGSASPHVNVRDVLSHVIPIPPLHEQKAIVTKVEKLLAICDQLETQITTDQTHTEQLMQAVLKEAFSQSGEA